MQSTLVKVRIVWGELTLTFKVKFDLKVKLFLILKFVHAITYHPFKLGSPIGLGVQNNLVNFFFCGGWGTQGWGQIRICICKYKYKYGVFVFVFVFDQISNHVFVFVFVFDPPYLVYLTNTFSNTLFSWAVF